MVNNWSFKGKNGVVITDYKLTLRSLQIIVKYLDQNTIQLFMNAKERVTRMKGLYIL